MRFSLWEGKDSANVCATVWPVKEQSKVRNECANERTNAEAKRLERLRRSIPKVMRWEFEFAQAP
jgi:hypothetical protein